MRTGLNRSPAGAGAVSQTNPVGPDAVLGGCVFDPRDIPFLPLWPDLPAVFPRFESSRGDVLCPTEDVSKPTQSLAEAS